MDRRSVLYAVAAMGGTLISSGFAVAQTKDQWGTRQVELPRQFDRYYNMGGVLAFVVFDDVDPNLPSVVEGIGAVMPEADLVRLQELGARAIDRDRFFGDWYDVSSGSLLKNGSITTADGRTLEKPRLSELEGVETRGGVFSGPEPGSGGQFAYAFSWTPYGLQARPSEIQETFDSVVAFMFPREFEHEILDWTSPLLPEVSPNFEAGMEWWGVFLFTIYTPATRRLIVIMGSTTD